MTRRASLALAALVALAGCEDGDPAARVADGLARVVASARPTDLTGAGDVFAAAFLIRYADTDDPWEAARWGAAAASLVIEGPGVDAVPTLAAVEARLGAS